MPRVEGYVRGTLIKRPAQAQPAQGLSQEQQSAAATAVAQAMTRAAAAATVAAKSSAPSPMPAAAAPSPAAPQPQLKPMPPAALAIQADADAMDVDGASMPGQAQQVQRAAQLTPRSSIGALAAAAGAAAAAAAGSASPKPPAVYTAGPRAASAPLGIPGALAPGRLHIRPDSPESSPAAAAATSPATQLPAGGQPTGAFRTPAGQLRPAAAFQPAQQQSLADKENLSQLQQGSGFKGGALLGAAGAAAGKLLLSGVLLGRGPGSSGGKPKSAAGRSAGYQPSRFMSPGQQAALLHQQLPQQPQLQAGGRQPMEVEFASPAAQHLPGLGPLGAGAAAAGAAAAPPPFALHSIAEEGQRQRTPLAGLSPAQSNAFRSFR